MNMDFSAINCEACLSSPTDHNTSTMFAIQAPSDSQQSQLSMHIGICSYKLMLVFACTLIDTIYVYQSINQAIFVYQSVIL